MLQPGKHISYKQKGLFTVITSLAKEVMILVALVCLSVDITQKVMNGLG